MNENGCQKSNVVLFILMICDRICENRPPCTRYRNRDSTMSDVIEVWSRSGENLEAIACIVLEIQSSEAGELANLDARIFRKWTFIAVARACFA